MFKKLSIGIVLCLALMPFLVNAKINYTRSGNEDGFYQNGENLFNTLMSTNESKIRTLGGGGAYTPLVGDLDNDGYQEIVLRDLGTVEVWFNTTLTPQAQVTLNDEKWSNMILFDIDGDGNLEVIYAEATTKRIVMLENIDTSIYEDYLVDFSSLQHQAGAMIQIGCRGVNDCLLITSGTGKLYASFFNTTTATHQVEIGSISILQNWDTGEPQATVVADIDNNGGSEEYFFVVDEDDNSRAWLFAINVSDNQSVKKRWSAWKTTDDTSQRSFTPPIVGEFDGVLGNDGHEVIFGVRSGTSSNVYEYSKDGNLDATTSALTGNQISNLIVTSIDIFADDGESTGANSFCYIGFDTDSSELNFFCDNRQTASPPINYNWNNELYNITEATNIYNNQIHNVNNDDDSSSTEILTAYGVFSLDTDSETVSLEYQLSLEDISVISVDASQIGTEDIVLMNENKLKYIKSGIESVSNQTLSEINITCVSPCIFRDTFDYINPFSDNEWFLFRYDTFSYDTTKNPTVNKMSFTEDISYSITHILPTVETSIYSMEFDLNTNQEDRLNVVINDDSFQKIPLFEIHWDSDGAIRYKIQNDTSTTGTTICSNCYSSGTTNNYRIISFFQDINIPLFNQSKLYGKTFTLLKDDEVLGVNLPMSPTTSTGIKSFDFVKDPERDFNIDDLVWYRGTDPDEYNEEELLYQTVNETRQDCLFGYCWNNSKPSTSSFDCTEIPECCYIGQDGEEHKKPNCIIKNMALDSLDNTGDWILGNFYLFTILMVILAFGIPTIIYIKKHS